MPGQWEESKHPRADDGRFGEGSGHSGGVPRSARAAGAAYKAVSKAVARKRKLGAVASSAVKSARTAKPAGAAEPPRALPYANYNALPENERWKALAQIEKQPPRPDGALVHAIGNAGIKDDLGRVIALNQDGQRAVRQHFSGLAAKYGISVAAGQDAGAHTIETAPDADMGGAAGFKMQDGRIQLGHNIMTRLSFHAGDGAVDAVRKEGIRVGYPDPGLEAYNIMMHETLHAHGPTLTISQRPDGSHNQAHHVLAEEMSTEMAAQHISTTENGVRPYDNHLNVGYGPYLQPAIKHVEQAAGVSHEQAYDAVAHAALTLKRRSGAMDASEALRGMAEDALRKLQKFNPETYSALFRQWDALSAGILDKVVEINANAKSLK